jgi:4-amino-4-deoxy-L-arabinose transferase-like glycosyltransferase
VLRPEPAPGRTVWIALGTIVLVYLATRLSLVWRFPVFSDEAAYAGWAQRVHDSASDRFVSLANGKEPLLSWLGAVLIWLGIGSLTALRLISVASGLVSLTVAVLLGRRLGGWWSGIAAGVVYTLLPLFVVHDVLGLMDPLVAATAMVSLYLMVRLAEKPRLDLAMLLGLSLGAGVLTKASAQLTVALMVTGVLLVPWRSRRALSWVASIVVALAVCGLIHSVLKLSPLYYEQAQIQRSAVAVRGFHAAFAHPLRWFDLNWPGYQSALVGYLTVPMVLLALAGFVYGLRARQRLAVVLGIWVLANLVADVLFGETGYARYLLPAIAPLVVLAGHGVAQLALVSRRVVAQSRWTVAIAAGVVALVAIEPLYLTGSVLASPATARYPGLDEAQFVTSWTAGQTWHDAARALRRLAGGQKGIVALGGLTSGALGIELHSDRNLSLVRSDDPSAPRARFVLESDVPLQPNEGPGDLRLVWREARPRHGVVVSIYERTITVDGTVVTTADQLRTLIGGGDKRFDEYTRAHPRVGAWYAWYASTVA